MRLGTKLAMMRQQQAVTTSAEDEALAKGIKKNTGKLKKGFKYAKGGRVVKAAAKRTSRRKR
ncbi:MAG: hypothetical protein ACFB13_21185 [Kiloniellaceae bacterium]